MELTKTLGLEIVCELALAAMSETQEENWDRRKFNGEIPAAGAVVYAAVQVLFGLSSSAFQAEFNLESCQATNCQLQTDSWLLAIVRCIY